MHINEPPHYFSSSLPYSILCCLWTCLSFSRPLTAFLWTCAFRRICLTAACAATECFWTCLFKRRICCPKHLCPTAALCCFRTCLSYSSLCCLYSLYSTADCASLWTYMSCSASGRASVLKHAACATPGHVCSSAACAAPWHIYLLFKPVLPPWRVSLQR